MVIFLFKLLTPGERGSELTNIDAAQLTSL